MALRIEDYALIGDCQTAALVGRDGSIDWLCLPRFDSAACFAALLGSPGNGRWRIAPAGEVSKSRRRYVGNTLVLETEFEAEAGAVAVTDFMPVREAVPDLVRVVEGRRGTVPVRSELVIRPDYGSVVPWVQKVDGGLSAVAGPDAFRLRSPVPNHGENLSTVAEFTVAAGQRVPFVLTYHRSYDAVPEPIDPEAALTDTLAWWEAWAGRCTYAGVRKDLVVRSLITLKAMTFAPSGGVVAAPTAALPEFIGGVRNWDYRYCWLRDAYFVVQALNQLGATRTMEDYLNYITTVIELEQGGDIKPVYGILPDQSLEERVITSLPGFKGMGPVRRVFPGYQLRHTKRGWTDGAGIGGTAVQQQRGHRRNTGCQGKAPDATGQRRRCTAPTSRGLRQRPPIELGRNRHAHTLERAAEQLIEAIAIRHCGCVLPAAQGLAG